MFAVQIARAFGAHVTAVDSSDKLEMLRDIGADQVVDYTTTDFTKGTQVYDLVVDIPGNHPFSAIRRVLREDGRYIFIGHENFGQGTGRIFGSSVLRFVRLSAMAPFVSQQLINRPPDDAEDPMSGLTRLLATGGVVPVIDRTYSLSEVPDAIRYLQAGGVRGKVVISM